MSIHKIKTTMFCNQYTEKQSPNFWSSFQELKDSRQWEFLKIILHLAELWIRQTHILCYKLRSVQLHISWCQMKNSPSVCFGTDEKFKLFMAETYSLISGAKVIPIPSNLPDDKLRKIFDSVNGLVFPGGAQVGT